jgi:hypothetical protein
MIIDELLTDPAFWWLVFVLLIISFAGVYISEFAGRIVHNRRLERRERARHWQISPEIEIGKTACFRFVHSLDPERSEQDIEFTGRPVWYSLQTSRLSKRHHVGDILFELIDNEQCVGYVHAMRREHEFTALKLLGPIAKEEIVSHLMKEGREPRTFVSKLGERSVYPVKHIHAPTTRDARSQFIAMPAAIDWALRNADGLEFLRLWKDGHEARIREHWPQVPDEVFAGAPQFHKLQVVAGGVQPQA